MYSCVPIKGSRNNHSPEFAPRFVSGWVDLREHNRRRRKDDVENCASEDRPNLARRWDAKMGRSYFASPNINNIIGIKTLYPLLDFVSGGRMLAQVL